MFILSIITEFYSDNSIYALGKRTRLHSPSSGKLKLDPPRPPEKKSALRERMNKNFDQKSPLPPIAAADNRKATAKQRRKETAKGKKGGKVQAYQVRKVDNLLQQLR